ncbi:aspartate kinase [Tepidibacillus decaturensis]|uniref:Aspartokinase n=1 Tax=Tepidibacillus decaturensis TaxID=1413211 RepID=A0A135L7N3_9BACI|nr:aspartate kinase [Tepidibacillus decaturensis]KXG44980.1 aspartate kinase [Tepidibacillus decaturensis]
MGIVVQKFGGTSVGTIDRIKNVAKIVTKTKEQGNQVVVVVSAMGDSTDDLLDMAHQITSTPSSRELDMLLTTGEQVSISLLAMALQEIGFSAISFTGWQAGVKTESVHSKARITDISSERIVQELKNDKIVIVAGFQGVSEEGEITTLGRGGSDTSAVALAAALKADLCEIYTDVDGVYTTDPRIEPKAKKLKEVSFDEMLELANLGAVVLHPRAVENAKKFGVHLVVRSSLVQVEGTVIKEEHGMEHVKVVTGVAYDMDVARVQVIGLENKINALSDLFSTLAKEKVNVDMIVTSDYGEDKINVSFSITSSDLQHTLAILERYVGSCTMISHEDHLAKVSIVGAGMISNPGVAAKMFEVLSNADIPIKMVTTSEIKVSCLVPKEYAISGVQELHRSFELDHE